MKILDTCFLIHLQREWARSETGPARRYLGLQTGEEFGISVITVLEFLEGYGRPVDGERFLAPFLQFQVTTGVARIGSRLRRALRERGERIGDFDVLIAATALADSLPLVTDNVRHFQRIEGLVVESYR